MKRHFLALAVITTLASCSPATEELAIEGPDVDAIQQAEIALNAAIAADDVNAAFELYHPNAGLVVQTGELLIPPDIRDALQELAEDPNGALELEPSAIEVASGGMAYSFGHFTERRTADDGRVRGEVGTGLRVWIRHDGGWRILRETRTSRSNWTD